jgi:hypothetical protein
MGIRHSKEEIAESTDKLRAILPPGSQIRTIVTHVSPSGMTRWIRLFAMSDGELEDISWRAGMVMGCNVNSRNHGGIEIGGCGMDMGFHAVYSLSRSLYRDGFTCTQYADTGNGRVDKTEGNDDYHALKRAGLFCPSNDHSNIRQSAFLNGTADLHHSDGGYAITQRWL